MIRFIKKIFKVRPKQESWYLIYGLDDLDDDDEPSYGYWVAYKFGDGWSSCCGKTIINVKYIEPLF